MVAFASNAIHCFEFMDLTGAVRIDGVFSFVGDGEDLAGCIFSRSVSRVGAVVVTIAIEMTDTHDRRHVCANKSGEGIVALKAGVSETTLCLYIGVRCIQRLGAGTPTKEHEGNKNREVDIATFHDWISFS